MAKELLSPLKIKNAKPANKEYLLADGDGLFLRVRPTGDKSWYFIYSFNKKRVKIGLNGSNLKKIRDQADDYRKQLADGINPKQKLLDDGLARQRLEQEKLAITARVTVNQLFERWEQLELNSHRDQGAAIKRIFNKDVLPNIGAMAVEDVRKSHIVAIVDTILQRGANRMAKMTLASIRQFFRFAQDRDIIEFEPTASIRKAKIGKPDTERERVLSEAEIRELVQLLPKANLARSTQYALWIQLSTGCRIGELLKAKWTDIDFEGKTWTIPAENSKNGMPLKISLSDFTVTQFINLKKVTRQSAWCYCKPPLISATHY